MRESRLSGSVEGVVSNHDPYSDPIGGCDFPFLRVFVGYLLTISRSQLPENRK